MLLLGGLPMANLLVVVLIVHSGSRARWRCRPGWAGFVAAGAAALLLYAAAAARYPRPCGPPSGGRFG
jgi:hypothetical protein